MAEIEMLFHDSYRPAVVAHMEYEVFAKVRNKKALQEFEAALSHLMHALLEDDRSELAHFKSHCDRVTIETTEYIAESYLLMLGSRIDSYYRHPRLARLLFVAAPTRASEEYAELQEMKDLVAEGRQNKGHDHSMQRSLSCFQKAVEIGKRLDQSIPFSAFGDRLFALILSVVMLALGYLLGLFT
ncbi:MAG: hypothetical protein ISS69_09195 [Phycisphaerae bacterium]|nr:hypothetical protein [Phycisphaerae bacterium]